MRVSKDSWLASASARPTSSACSATPAATDSLPCLPPTCRAVACATVTQTGRSTLVSPAMPSRGSASARRTWWGSSVTSVSMALLPSTLSMSWDALPVLVIQRDLSRPLVIRSLVSVAVERESGESTVTSAWMDILRSQVTDVSRAPAMQLAHCLTFVTKRMENVHVWKMLKTKTVIRVPVDSMPYQLGALHVHVTIEALWMEMVNAMLLVASVSAN